MFSNQVNVQSQSLSGPSGIFYHSLWAEMEQEAVHFLHLH